MAGKGLSFQLDPRKPWWNELPSLACFLPRQEQSQCLHYLTTGRKT